MNCTVKYSNGRSEDYDTLQEAMTAVLAQYPDGYAVDAGGFEVDADTEDDGYDVRGRRAAMVWASEEEAENDPGVNAVATLNVEDK
jgi:hypothetical protein